MNEEKTKTRYNHTELAEFKVLIQEKIKGAREELYELAGTLSAANTNGDDAAIAGKTLEDGSATFEKGTDQSAGRTSKEIHRTIGSRFVAHREQDLWNLQVDRQTHP